MLSITQTASRLDEIAAESGGDFKRLMRTVEKDFPPGEVSENALKLMRVVHQLRPRAPRVRLGKSVGRNAAN